MLLAGVRAPNDAEASAVQMCYTPRSYEYDMTGVLPLAIYSRYLEARIAAVPLVFSDIRGTEYARQAHNALELVTGTPSGAPGAHLRGSVTKMGG